MNKSRHDRILIHIHLPTRAEWARAGKFAAVAGVTALSAIIVKESRSNSELTPLASVVQTPAGAVSDSGEGTGAPESGGTSSAGGLWGLMMPASSDGAASGEASGGSAQPTWVNDASIRYFNGRPVRPARTMSMLVTAYSPDAISCAGSDDGITASVHHVDTNAGALVAADTRILPLGTLVSVPGYDENNVVPVLDRGGAIKGKRLDVLYPTHRQARKWGAQRLEVTIWEYADGLPADDYRSHRGVRRKW